MIEFEDDDEGQETFEDTPLQTAELKRIFASVHAVLERMLRAAPTIDADTPQTLIAKLSELQSAHQQIVAAEEALHAQYGPIARSDDLDLTAIRAEIGGQLDRLRAAIMADKLPFETDPCAACSAALSL
jgi:hypothetical protein